MEVVRYVVEESERYAMDLVNDDNLFLDITKAQEELVKERVKYRNAALDIYAIKIEVKKL